MFKIFSTYIYIYIMMRVNIRNMQSCLRKYNKLNKSHLVGQLLNSIHDALTHAYKIHSGRLQILCYIPLINVCVTIHFQLCAFVYSRTLLSCPSTLSLLTISSGVPRNFVRGGGVQQIQLRTDRTGIWGRQPPSQEF